MAYRVEENGDIVINGFQAGIGDDPYTGLTDARNVNLISVPGEASVNFSTSNIASSSVTGQMTAASGSIATYSGVVGTLEDYLAIYFVTQSSFTGFTLATPYWITKNASSSSTFAVFTDYAKRTPASLGGSGVVNFVAYQMGIVPSWVSGGSFTAGGIQHFAQPINIQGGGGGYHTFGVDGAGQVWGNQHTTGTNSYWTYTGNTIVDGSNIRNGNGNGLVYWRVSNGLTGSSLTEVDYLFTFRNSQIDFMVVKGGGSGVPTTKVWTNGWDPSNGNYGSSNYLTVPAGTNGSHHAIVSSDGRVYFCDGNNVQKFFQVSPTSIFQTGTVATYTYSTFNLLPIDDISVCLAPFGTNILIGAQGYNAYQWNTTSNLVSNYIPIAESYISKIVTVNTNAFMFAGNRGRIYITNGSQANLWKKIPDHITNTIEPKYQWGGATSTKNQLYFSFKTLSSDSTAISSLGGLWACDLDSTALRMTNKLSYGTYNGYATALLPQVYNPVTGDLPTGTGLFIGWQNGFSTDPTVTTCGVDLPSNNPYTGGQAFITSEIIPIGTSLSPTTSHQLEFKLSAPLLSGETVALYMASGLASNTDPTFTFVGVSSGDNSLLSGNFPITVEKQQWVMVKAGMNGISSGGSPAPSFNRLTEMRIIRGNG